MKLALALVLVATWAHAEQHPRATEVLVVKRAGVTAYEEVSEEFGERCRVRARVISFADEKLDPSRISPNALVVTIGQEALDALTGGAGAHARLIPTMAFFTGGLAGPPATPHPELIFRVLTTARKDVQTIAAIYGPRADATIEEARAAATKMGLNLVAARVSDGPGAVRALHRLVDGPGRAHVQAIWLPGDTDVVTPQVFQYALRLQLELGVPVAAATRQQVHSGALLAVDFAPRAAGRAAADIANRILEGLDAAESRELEVRGGARITVNAQAARRLGADTPSLSRMGATIE